MNDHRYRHRGRKRLSETHRVVILSNHWNDRCNHSRLTQPYRKLIWPTESLHIDGVLFHRADALGVYAATYRYLNRGWGLKEMSVPHYSPQLIQTMRDALEAVMTNVPVGHATPGVKAHLAEIILQAAAQGLTSHDTLVAVASDQIQSIISMLT
jgi:hypothetical protein